MKLQETVGGDQSYKDGLWKGHPERSVVSVLYMNKHREVLP